MTTEMIPLEGESVALDGFYAPRFGLRIKPKSGSGAAGSVDLPEQVLRDIVSVTYKDNEKEIDSVELQVNNWDAENCRFKYIGLDGADETVFDPCNREFELYLGYGTTLELMMTGTFTTLEPSFPSGGAPTLTVRGLNVLHQLRRKQYTYAWESMKDSAIALDIAGLTDKGKKRFPLPIVISKTAMGDETAIEYVAQENQYDIDFLFTRARKRGYVVVVNEGDDTHPYRHVFFGPSDNSYTGRLYELEWRKSLIDFHPTLTTANQVKSVTVKGWNRRTKREITKTVTLDDPKLNRNRDLYELLQRCDPREEITVNEPVSTPQEARKRAEAILMSRQKEMVKASGTTIGLPKLRAGFHVYIKNLGARFSGRYFIAETVHTLNDRGYVTKFKARRENTEG